MAFLRENLGTIIVGAIVAVLVVLVIVTLIRLKKEGKALGSGCQGCPNKPYCHRKSRNGCSKNTSKKD